MAKVASAPPDLMLVDIALAGSDGRRLAQYLRQREAQLVLAGGNEDTLLDRQATERTIPIVAVSSFAPGGDGNALRSSSFGLTRKGGFSESELLELIVQSARQVRPRYAQWSNDAAMAIERQAEPL
jgi:CheY-like chemotaxis protein